MKKTLSVIVILGATMTAYGFYGTRAIEIMPNVRTVAVTEGKRFRRRLAYIVASVFCGAKPCGTRGVSLWLPTLRGCRGWICGVKISFKDVRCTAQPFRPS